MIYLILYPCLVYLNFQWIKWYCNLINHKSLSASLKNQDSFGDSEKLFIMKMLALLFPIAEIIIVKNFESLFPIAILLVVYVILYAILKPEIDSDKIYWKNHDKKNHEKNC